MTGAQMAAYNRCWTRLLQLLQTGRNADDSGEPVRMAELIAQLPGCYYSERVALNNPKNIIGCKRAIKRAIVNQMEGKGLSFVEVLSPCPTGWNMSPVEAVQWIEKRVVSTYPLGVKKDAAGGHEQGDTESFCLELEDRALY